MTPRAYSLPSALKSSGKVLETYGIEIEYGPNPAPVPELLSDQAKSAWPNLPRLPLAVRNADQLGALRRFTAAREQEEYKRLKDEYAIRDVSINGVRTMWSTPPDLRHHDKTLIFIHGGAYVMSTRKAQLPLQAAVASRLGLRVVSIGYPKAPEHPYPAAPDAIVEVYRALLEAYGATDLGLFGASSGGGLVLATLMRLKRDGLPLPAASAALSPMADLKLSGDLFQLVGDNDPVLSREGMLDAVAGYCGEADRGDPLVSPVFGDYTGVTPLFFLAGTRELVGDDAVRAAAKARGDGCDVTLIVNDGMWHAAIGDGSGIPEQQFAFDELIKFFEKHLTGG